MGPVQTADFTVSRIPAVSPLGVLLKSHLTRPGQSSSRPARDSSDLHSWRQMASNAGGACSTDTVSRPRSPSRPPVERLPRHLRGGGLRSPFAPGTAAERRRGRQSSASPVRWRRLPRIGIGGAPARCGDVARQRHRSPPRPGGRRIPAPDTPRCLALEGTVPGLQGVGPGAPGHSAVPVPRSWCTADKSHYVKSRRNSRGLRRMGVRTLTPPGRPDRRPWMGAGRRERVRRSRLVLTGRARGRRRGLTEAVPVASTVRRRVARAVGRGVPSWVGSRADPALWGRRRSPARPPTVLRRPFEKGLDSGVGIH